MIHAGFPLFAVQPRNQSVILLIGSCIQPAAVRQVIEDLKIRRMLKKVFIGFRMQADIVHQLLVNRMPGAFDDACGKDGVNINPREVSQGILCQMQPRNMKGAIRHTDILHPDPVFGHLSVFIFVFNTEPLSLMNGPEKIARNGVHFRSPPVLPLFYHRPGSFSRCFLTESIYNECGSS